MSAGGAPRSKGEIGIDQELADLMEQGVVVLDDALCIVGWNRWMEAATRLSAPLVIGRSIFKIFPELNGTDRATTLDRALKGEVVVYSHRFHEYFLPLAAPAGFAEVSRMQQSVRIAPRIQDGHVVGLVILVQDVTERTIREAELRVALERAEVANRAKAEFLSAMSHELRTPLNVVLGYADLLINEIGGSINPAQRQKVERIKTSVWHLLGIIDEILTFSRVEAGKETVTMEPVDLSGIVQDSLVMLQNEAESRGLALVGHLPPGQVNVISDARRLRQILLNLLGNALKFTDRGSVIVTLRAEDERIVLDVADTGRGIESRRLEDVFEPFTRVATKGGPEGTGLGLPLSRRLAELLGGSITVRSELGVGSTFTLTLPLRVADPAPVQLPA
jgi:signal transduction histidine kinase